MKIVRVILRDFQIGPTCFPFMLASVSITSNIQIIMVLMWLLILNKCSSHVVF
jgi:hypothetical protein